MYYEIKAVSYASVNNSYSKLKNLLFFSEGIANYS